MSDSDQGAPTSLDGLAARLRALREATSPRVSQTAAGRVIGTSQNKISRAEAGQHLLTPEEVKKLVSHYGGTPREARELAGAATALADRVVDSRLILRRQGGTASYQQSVQAAERAAAVVSAYQPSLVLGVLQTPRYAGVIFGPGGEDAVTARLARHRMMLDDESRRWVLIQTEGSLLWNLGGADVMAEQLAAIREASERPNVDLRIITSRQAMPFAVNHGFHLYDRQAVQIGTLTASTMTSNPREVDQYVTTFDRLAELAVAGDDARREIDRIAASYR